MDNYYLISVGDWTTHVELTFQHHECFEQNEFRDIVSEILATIYMGLEEENDKKFWDIIIDQHDQFIELMTHRGFKIIRADLPRCICLWATNGIDVLQNDVWEGDEDDVDIGKRVKKYLKSDRNDNASTEKISKEK